MNYYRRRLRRARARRAIAFWSLTLPSKSLCVSNVWDYSLQRGWSGSLDETWSQSRSGMYGFSRAVGGYSKVTVGIRIASYSLPGMS